MNATIIETTLCSQFSDFQSGPLSQTQSAGATGSRKAIWAGRILSGLGVLFLTFDAAMKIFAVPAAVQGTIELGYPANVLLGLGIVQLVCLALYLIPRTAPLVSKGTARPGWSVLAMAWRSAVISLASIS